MPAPSNSSTRTRKTAFTIVEMLVVISIIGLLLGLLLPTLAAMNRSSRKTAEMNSLTQVGKAWLMYANNSNDAALPGFLEVAVQAPRVADTSTGWGVRYYYQDKVTIPPAANPNGDPALNIAGPWTWRLLSYLDYSQDMILGYRGSDPEVEYLFRGTDPNSPSYEISSRPADAWSKVALVPAFGYNGYYVGGYWSMVDVSGLQTPRYKFYDHCEINNPFSSVRTPLATPITIGQIQRSSQIMAFCSSTSIRQADAGLLPRLGDETPGSFWVTPPIVGTTRQWGQSADGPMTYGPSPFPAFGADLPASIFIPLGRHGGNAAVFYPDGHVDKQAFSGLEDQRKWIDSAGTRWFEHDQCPPSADP